MPGHLASSAAARLAPGSPLALSATFIRTRFHLAKKHGELIFPDSTACPCFSSWYIWTIDYDSSEIAFREFYISIDRTVP